MDGLKKIKEQKNQIILCRKCIKYTLNMYIYF